MKPILFPRFKAIVPAHRQRGASLLEGIAYLGIAALVVIGAVALMQGAFSNAQSNRALEDVVSIRTNVRKLYMGQGGTPYQPAGESAMNATLVAARAFPSSLAIAGNNVTNPWNGAVTVSQAAGGAQFTITYNNVPQDVCVNLLSGTMGWTAISVNAADPGITAFPVTPTAAAAACTQASNVIAWSAS